MSTASGTNSRTCSSESHRSASTTIASGSSTDTASISASSVSGAATTSNPLVPSRASMLPTRPAVITRSRSPRGCGPASGAGSEVERSTIDMARSLPENCRRPRCLRRTNEYHRARRRSCRTMGLRTAPRGTTRPSPVRTIDSPPHIAHGRREAAQVDELDECEQVVGRPRLGHRDVASPYAQAMGRVSGLVDRVGVLRPLRVRDFAFLWIGLAVSFIGDGVYIIAIAWQTYDLSNSPSALAAVGIAWSLPQVLLVLISGVLSDRVDRRLLMIAGDVIRGIAIATIGILSIGGTLTMTSLISLVVVFGVGQALFGPAFSSIVPQVVPEDLLVEANALGQFVRPIAWTLIGPLVGGALVASLGTGWAFVADAGTFAFSAVMVGLMRSRPKARDVD